MTRLLLPLLLLVLCIPAAVTAQTLRDTSVGRSLAAFRDGEPIRVALLRSRFGGAFMGTRGDTLFFGDPGMPPMVMLFNAVDTVWRAGRATWSGAAAGAMLGGVAFAFSGRLLPAAGGALAGGAVGALVGSSIRRWRQVYP